MSATSKIQKQITKILEGKGWSVSKKICMAKKSYGCKYTADLFFLSETFGAVYWSEGKNQLSEISASVSLENLEIVLQKIDSVVKNSSEYKSKQGN